MHRLLLFVVLLALSAVLFVATPSFAQGEEASAPPDTSVVFRSLDNELSRLDTRTALILPSQTVDEFPVWSPDGSRLAANVAGTWYAVRLDSLALGGATWRDSLVLGVLRSESGGSVGEAPEASDWQEAANFAPRSIRTERGTSIELRQEGMSTSFVIAQPNSEPETLWTSGSENCHSLTLSPDERYIAFICEMNGVFAYQLDQAEE